MQHADGQDRIALILALVALVVGLFARMQGLGAWPFEVDEYYLARATGSILENGLPNFECGGFYTRGLLQQYFSAGLMQLFENDELAMRLYPLLLNLGALAVALLLGRRLGGPAVGYLSLALMSLSLWEIEFARFARMYAPFQLLTLIQAYLFVRVVFDARHTLFKWMLVVALLAILTYDAAVFLMLPVIVALLRAPRLRASVPLLLTGGVMALAVAFVLIPFRTLGVRQTPLPADLAARLAGQSDAIISLPDLGHVIQLGAHPGWLTALLVVAGGSAIYSARRAHALTALTVVAWLVAGLCFALSLVPLGLVIYLATTFLLISGDDRRAGLRFLMRVVLPAMSIALAYWGLYLVAGLGMAPKAAAKALLKYPNLFDPVIYVFADTVPVLCVVLLVPIIACVALAVLRPEPRSEPLVALAALAATLLVGVALLNPNSHETRYSFFVYPLLLCMFSHAVLRLADALPGRLAAARPVWPLVLLAAFAMTEDVSLRHYRDIDSAEINFRTVYPPALQEHFKFRDDNRTPAEYVNARLGRGDIVIIAESGVERYVERVDYRYKNAAGKDFVNHISCGLEHDVWSNAPVLYDEAQLRALIDAASATVWIIKRNFEAPGWLAPYEVFLAPDGRMQVLRVPPAAPPPTRPVA